MSAKILYVEDEELIRDLVLEDLSDEGYETIEAENGKAGLKAILEENPDLVLCDIGMPEMDGHALLIELRTNHPGLAHMPFIFMTALADPQQVLAGKRLGADDYLTKPIDFDMLHAVLVRTLKKRFDPSLLP